MLNRQRAILMILLGCHSMLLAYNAWWMSPTLDEPAHLVAGLSHWQRADFSLYRVNPPLVRLVAALPVLLVGQEYELPEKLSGVIDRKEFRLGEAFMDHNGRRSLWLVTLGRWACIPFSLLAALTCFWWARDLYGQWAGLAAATLWCFSPLVLGHAALLTPDVAGAALGLLACYTFWLWLKEPTWHRTLTTGLILGLAELSKSTLILFYPLWPVLWLLYRWPDRAEITARHWWNEASMLLARLLIGLYVINLGYLGTGSFIPLKEYYFRSELFGAADEKTALGNRFKESWLGKVPVPLPYDYVLGIDHQQRDFEKFWGPSYLRGQFQETGWWYYYLYGVLVKAPIGTLALIILAVAARWWHTASGVRWRDDCILLVPAAIVFVVASSKTGFSHHLRYIFPCIPLIFVWVSRLFNVADRSADQFNIVADRSTGQSLDNQRIDGAIRDHGGWAWLHVAAVVCLSATVVSSLWRYPHSLAYFNELAGGPRQGAEHLLNSNIDWGQDLLHLESWIRRNPGNQAVYLAFDNNGNPFVLDIPKIEPWPLRRRDDSQHTVAAVPDGYYAISVNQLYEFPRWVTHRDGSKYNVDGTPFESLRAMTPVGWAGYSIRVYSADQVRDAYRRQMVRDSTVKQSSNRVDHQ
jgi:4-amino-4-deoxy-L-arabinose transferase-like glycosyltransferase